MTDTIQSINNVAPLRNVRALVTLVERVQDRAYGLPGMATFFGYSGYGKSTAAIYAANQFDACYVEVKEYWTVKKFLQSILSELSVAPKRNVSDMAEQIAQELLIRNVPLLVDEADILVRKGMIEHVRGIHQDSQVPVILIGEEQMPQKLQRYERVHNRMLDQVPALPACMDDLEHLARIYCPGIALHPDFREKLLNESHHSLRRLVVNLAKVQEMALLHGADEVDLDSLGDVSFQAFQAPAPRRNLG